MRNSSIAPWEILPGGRAYSRPPLRPDPAATPARRAPDRRLPQRISALLVSSDRHNCIGSDVILEGVGIYGHGAGVGATGEPRGGRAAPRRAAVAPARRGFDPTVWPARPPAVLDHAASKSVCPPGEAHHVVTGRTARLRVGVLARRGLPPSARPVPARRGAGAAGTRVPDRQLPSPSRCARKRPPRPGRAFSLPSRWRGHDLARDAAESGRSREDRLRTPLSASVGSSSIRTVSGGGTNSRRTHRRKRLIPRVRPCRLDRPSPKVRREAALRRAISALVPRAKYQAPRAKRGQTCASAGSALARRMVGGSPTGAPVGTGFQHSLRSNRRRGVQHPAAVLSGPVHAAVAPPAAAHLRCLALARLRPGRRNAAYANCPVALVTARAAAWAAHHLHLAPPRLRHPLADPQRRGAERPPAWSSKRAAASPFASATFRRSTRSPPWWIGAGGRAAASTC